MKLISKRTLAFSAAGVVLVLIVSLHLQVQRTGTVRFVRSGDSVRVLRHFVGWAGRYSGQSCVVAAGPFRATVVATDSDEREFPAQVQFEYDPPSQIPANWPEGDWCTVLRDQVTRIVDSWTRSSPRDALIIDRREAGRAAAEALQAELKSAGLAATKVSVRFVVPEILSAARSVPEVVAGTIAAKPVIFIGLDGADWALLEPLMESGVMPNLSALRREGRYGILKTQQPPLSPLVWTTMMTGTSPLQHRILDFTRFHPLTGQKEPITADERQSPAIWNMTTYGGKTSAVFGLWATYPAEPVRGLMVSDRFFSFLFTEEMPPAGVVFPPSRDAWARNIRSTEEKAVGYDEVRAYLPWLSSSEFESRIGSKDPYSHPVSALHRILVETNVYHRLVTDYLKTKTPDLTIVYMQGTDSIGHVFASFNPPRQPEISEADFAKYSEVSSRYFQKIDQLLGEYKRIAEQKGAVLMIASDHGFRWLEGRPTELSSFATPTAAKWHRDEGIYLLWGSGISAGKGPQGSVDQVCPTLTQLAGLPRGAAMKRPALVAFRDEKSSVDYQQFYSPVAAPAAPDEKTVSEDIAKLRALGYIGATEQTSAPSRGSTRTAGSYNNEALVDREQGKRNEAVEAWEKALSIDPHLASAAWNLSNILHAENRDLDRSDELLVRSFADGLPEGLKYLIGRAIGYQRGGKADRSLKLLEAAVRARPDDPELRMFRGRYRIDRGDCAGALEDFRIAQQLAPRNAIAFASAGIAEICLGNRGAAQAYFRKSLEIEPAQPKIRAFLATLQ